MKHKKRIVALIIVIAGGLVVGAPRITAAPSTPGDEAIVAAMADPPAFLFYTACFEPTRANISFYRAGCDERAESTGYSHGILRPLHQNDDIEVAPLCEIDPKTGSTTGVRYYCFGVGGR